MPGVEPGSEMKTIKTSTYLVYCSFLVHKKTIDKPFMHQSSNFSLKPRRLWFKLSHLIDVFLLFDENKRAEKRVAFSIKQPLHSYSRHL